jgi:hypothetical protein
MFKFKFERNNDGNYEALLSRKWSNLNRADDIENMGEERLNGVALKIVIETELLYGEKYYKAYLQLSYGTYDNRVSVIDALGSGYTLKDCKEEITEWFTEHFFELAFHDMSEYVKKDCKEIENYYYDWCNFRTPRQQEELSKARKDEKDKEVTA